MSLRPVDVPGLITGSDWGGANGDGRGCLESETGGDTGDSTNPLHLDLGVCIGGDAGLSFLSSLGVPCAWWEESSGLPLGAGSLGGF